MAVIKGLPGLVVGITCNGETLAEYSDPEERKAKPRTVTKFIESQTDANFQIEYCYDAAKFRRNKKDHYELHLYLDGDEDLDVGLVGKLADLGTITVEFHKFIYGAEIKTKAAAEAGVSPTQSVETALESDADDFGGTEMNLPDVVPEKNLKGQAITHQAQLDAPIIKPIHSPARKRPPPPPPAARKRIYDRSGPRAIFHFKYRSRAALEMLDVIRCTPEPVPLEDRDPDSLTLDELRELARRAKERREFEQNARIKQEAEDETVAVAAAAGQTSAPADEDCDDDDEIEIVSCGPVAKAASRGAPAAVAARADSEVGEDHAMEDGYDHYALLGSIDHMSEGVSGQPIAISSAAEETDGETEDSDDEMEVPSTKRAKIGEGYVGKGKEVEPDRSRRL